jgi:hypothetical protein
MQTVACIADLLGTRALLPGFNGCPCPACQAKHPDCTVAVGRPHPATRDHKMAAANDKED